MGDAVLLEYIRAMLGVATPGSGDPKHSGQHYVEFVDVIPATATKAGPCKNCVIYIKHGRHKKRVIFVKLTACSLCSGHKILVIKTTVGESFGERLSNIKWRLF